MIKPDFEAMNQKELQKYVLEHREDQDAFYVYIDRLHTEGTWIEMPAIQSDQDLENYPEFIESIRRSAKPRDNTI
ncbi:MAG: hypothetical protein WCD18_12715 [Thermosynechococcaceae cyanobacterium]